MPDHLRELRVRDHGAHARVEVGASDLDLATARRDEIAARLAEVGFASLELAVYRSPAEKARASGLSA